MADYFCGFNTSSSKMFDESGDVEGEMSEEEYDALNDETFGACEGFDWEHDHQQLAAEVENSRRNASSTSTVPQPPTLSNTNVSMDMSDLDFIVSSQLEASLSRLVLDEPDQPPNLTPPPQQLPSSGWQQELAVASYIPPQQQMQPNLQNLGQFMSNMQQIPNVAMPNMPLMSGMQPPLCYQHPNMPNVPNMHPMPNMQQMHPGAQITRMQMSTSVNDQTSQNPPQVPPQASTQGHGLAAASPLGSHGAHIGHSQGQSQGPPQSTHMGHTQGHSLSTNTCHSQGQLQGPHRGHTQGHPQGPIRPPQGVIRSSQGSIAPPQGMVQGAVAMNQMLHQQQMSHQQQLMQQSQHIPHQPQMHAQQHNQIEQRTITPRSEQQSRPPGFSNAGSPQVMTSQNMVEYIQNNHPLLQNNNNFHNGNNYPILNWHLYQTTQNNYPWFHNSRLYRSQSLHMNGENASNGIPYDECDEYTDLMTVREKQWLVNIQMLQVSTMTPYVDDYYYTVMTDREARKKKVNMRPAHQANQQNHPLYATQGRQDHRDNRPRLNSVRHNSTSEDPLPRAYVPTQFENSLGKLQFGSVMAPRMLIDVDVVHSEPAAVATSSRAPSTTTVVEAPHVKKTKQALLDIEGLYMMVIRLEEINEPLAISSAMIIRDREEKAKQLALEAAKEAEDSDSEEGNLFLRNIEAVQRKQKECKDLADKRQVVNLGVAYNQSIPIARNLLDENKDELIIRIFCSVLADDRMQLILSIKKGRALLSRFLAKVPETHNQLRLLWNRVFRFIAQNVRRDDSTLDVFVVELRRYIQNSVGWPPILELCSLFTEALDPANTPHLLSSSFAMSCICVLVEKATTLSQKSDASAHERQWTKFLKTLARAFKFNKVTVARPLSPLPKKRLEIHIKLLQSRSSIEILQRGQTATEFSGLTKQDFSDQLLQHLC